jgi:alpha-tubulin suppressor-like RCC1 family protein
MQMRRGYSGGDLGRRGAVGRLTAVLVLLASVGAVLPAATNAASPGQLYAFGFNQEGQLGNETNFETGTPNPTPTLVTLPGEAGPVTQAATGTGFSLAITSGGQLYAFGGNGSGQLGYRLKGEDTVNPTPTLVTLPGEIGGVIQAAAGFDFSLVVTAGGQLYSFGYNWDGALGDDAHNGNGGPNPTPALVTLPGATGPVIQAAAGAYHSLALTATGQLYAFGQNFYGELGTELKQTRTTTPVLVTLPGAGGPVTQIAAGKQFSLAVTSSGQLYAFGENRNGELGNTTNDLTGEPNPMPTRVTLPGEVGPVTQVAAGLEHTLALTSSGQLYAFGDNQEGELGDTTNLEKWWPNPTPTPVGLPGASGRIVQIAADKESSFALTSTGELYAFGSNYWGELGFPPRKEAGKEADLPNPTPTRVELPANVETVSTGCWADQTLVVLADLALSTSSLSGGETGVPYNAQAQATGGAPPYRWSAAGLPAGLSIDPATGAVSGTPTAGGSYTPTVTVTDSHGIEASAVLTLTIQPLPVASSEAAPLLTSSESPPLSASSEPALLSPSSGAVLLSASSESAPLSVGLPAAPQGRPPSSMARMTSRGAPAGQTSSPALNAHSDSYTFSPSSWVVHKYLGQITKAGARSLDKPVGLAFNSAGDLFVSDADKFETGVKPEEHGYVDRYGPTGALECEVAGGFPWGELESVAVDDETGEVYVAEDFLFTASIWLLTPEGKCYKTPTEVEAGGLISLTVDNGPGPHHGGLYLIAHGPPYYEPRPYDIETNGKGELEGFPTELPEPLDEFTESDGEYLSTSGIAVDPTSGTIYLTNPANGEIDVYDKEDALQQQTLTTGEPFEPISVAVDPANGEVYAVDGAHKVVDEFNDNGEFIGEITGAHTPAGRFVEPRNVAVKPATHEVFVSDEGAHAIDIFSADEAEGPAPAPASESASEVGAVTATLNGAVERIEGEPLSWFFRYARGSACTGGDATARVQTTAGEMGLLHEHATIEKLEPSTAYSLCFSDEGTEGVLGIGTTVHFETGGLAPAGDPVSISQITPSSATLSGSVNPETQLTTYRFEYATNATFTGASVVGEGSLVKGTYPTTFVDPADLGGLVPGTTYYVRLYAENATGHYTSQATSFKTLPVGASAVSYWNASEGETVAMERLEGYVNPVYESTTCTFQYTTEAEYAQHGFTGTASVPCSSSPFGTSTTGFSEAVTATASGLQAGVTYDYRLIAANATGASEGPVAPATATFATWGPPTPATEPAGGVSPDSAALAGVIDPDHLATTYHFEYASEPAYTQATAEGKHNPYIGGLSTPYEHAGSGAIRETLPATTISGLLADTTYHYRLVASNEAGTRYGRDQTFTTEREPAASTTQNTPTGQGNTPASQPVSPPPATKPKPKTTSPRKPATLTNAQKLKRALKACRKKHSRRARVRCERQAHKRYQQHRRRS